MTNKELQILVEKISIQYFKKAFVHKAYFNPRLRTTGGRYMLKSHNIDINLKYFEEQGMEELIGIIKHELCHYHLHIEGKGYKHKDPEFKNLLHKVGGSRYCTPLNSRKEKQRFLFYSCSNCGLNFKRKRKIDTAKYVCGSCKGKLKFDKEIKVIL